MYLFTKYGDPVPWINEEVLVHLAGMRKILKKPGFHAYRRARRVWAKKPLCGPNFEG